MKIVIPKDSTSRILTVFIRDSSSTTGAGLGSLTSASGIVGGCVREGATGVALAVDEDVTTEGTYQAPSTAAHVRIGTPANMATGTHELHFHNNLWGAGAETVTITLGGATNMAPLNIEVQLSDPVRGLGSPTALPNAAADAAGGLPISDAGGLDLDNRMPAAAAITNFNVVFNTDFAANYNTTDDKWKVDVTHLGGTAQTAGNLVALIGTPVDNGNGATLAGNFIDTITYLDNIDSVVGSNFTQLQCVFGSTYTADSGTTTTFVDADRTEADTNYWAGSLVKFITGVCAGQTRLITGFTPGTDTITFYPAATQAIAAGVQYKIIPSGAINVAQWLGTAPATPATNGVPMVNVSQLGGTSVHATAAANWHTLFLNDGLVSGVELDTIASIDKMRKYFQLGYRKDAAIATDLIAEVAEINENRGNGGGAFANSTDALEALRDRGDAAWITIAAADVRAAVGLASANFDTQLADLPTNAELATSQGTADDATLAAIATLATYVDTEVAAIKTVVDAIKVITDALTAAAAAKLATSAGTMLTGTVDSTGFAPTTTQFEANDIAEATADHFNGRIILFTSGALQYQATTISDYSLASGRGHFTVVALTEAPTNNGTFIII